MHLSKFNFHNMFRFSKCASCIFYIFIRWVAFSLTRKSIVDRPQNWFVFCGEMIIIIMLNYDNDRLRDETDPLLQTSKPILEFQIRNLTHSGLDKYNMENS